MKLTVNIEKKTANAFVVFPEGSLDANTFPLFDEKTETVLEEKPKVVVFDLAKLEYLSSAGIRSILKFRKALTTKDGKTTFINLQPQIKKVFEIINALPSMQIFSNFEEMDEYLDKMQKKIVSGE